MQGRVGRARAVRKRNTRRRGPPASVRLNPGPGTADYLIAGGADHKSGEVDDGSVRFEAVEAWIRTLVPELGKEVTRWSGQVMDTFDYCGFIGRNPGNDNVYVVTGDSGQGMTHGALAGILLADLIRQGLKPRCEPVNDPASQDLGQTSFCMRPRRTHLGCQLRWNSTEQCWDCPCHGSHFGPDGAALNGPAIEPLKPAQLSGSSRAEFDLLVARQKQADFFGKCFGRFFRHMMTAVDAPAF